jgi:hypothetical protein
MKTNTDLYRSLREENFPGGIFIDDQPVEGLLYPDFYERKMPNGKVRRADINVTRDANGVEWVSPGGGTSLFDRPNVFTRAGWISFPIPNGTAIPDPITVVKQDFNKTFNATHYQIEVRTGMITKAALQGALDNFARAALARSVELSKGNIK